MALEYLQEKIDYHFFDCELLRSALKAPHRSDIEGTSDNGNRDLAKLGIRAVEIVKINNAINTENGTKKSRNTSDHWSKTIQGRAIACENLGIACYVVQSPRQQHEKPSTKVLANALSAIVGAMWLDLEKQNESIASTHSTVLRVLHGIDAAITDTSVDALTNEGTILVREGSDRDLPTPSRTAPEVMTPNETSDYSNSSTEAFITRWFSESQQDHLDGIGGTSLTSYDTSSLPNFIVPNEIQTEMQTAGILNCDLVSNGNTSNNTVLPQFDGGLRQPQNPSYIEGGGAFDARLEPANRVGDLSTALIPEKRKRLHEHNQRYHKSSLHDNLLRIELQKLESFPNSNRADLETLLDHAQIGQLSTVPSQVLQLRFMYLAIGSCQSLIDFKGQLHTARDMPAVSAQHVGLALSVTERFSAICRLDREEGLCVLSRRYHIVQLCETARETFLPNNQMIVETSQTFDPSHRAQVGNPTVLQEAALTDALLFMIKPDLKKKTKEFETFRRRIKRLQKLAKILQILIDKYGLGILALLPSGPTYSESSLTDNMLLSVTEQVFRNFSDLLHQQQGPFLEALSKAVEPAVIALVTGRLDSACKFPIESADVRLLDGLPKGSPEVSELVAWPSN